MKFWKGIKLQWLKGDAHCFDNNNETKNMVKVQFGSLILNRDLFIYYLVPIWISFHVLSDVGHTSNFEKCNKN